MRLRVSDLGTAGGGSSAPRCSRYWPQRWAIMCESDVDPRARRESTARKRPSQMSLRANSDITEIAWRRNKLSQFQVTTPRLGPSRLDRCKAPMEGGEIVSSALRAETSP